MARKVAVLALAAVVQTLLVPPGNSVVGMRLRPEVRQSLRNDTSPPLRDMRFPPPEPQPDREIPAFPPPYDDGPATGSPQAPDPVVQSSAPSPDMPAVELSFDALSNADNLAQIGGRVLPPDTNGDVGPNHYVHIVNLVLAVYNRTGTRLLGPLRNNALFSGFGGPCEDTNNGDPIVLYDHLADRWMLSQFALPNFLNGPMYQCIAVSQTPDPTGSYYRYEFLYSDTLLNDYPKFGVWPDAYYMSANQFHSFGFAGVGVVAFERDEMLAGRAADMVYFNLEPVDPRFSSLLPADLDGPPPPPGAPNPFAAASDNASGFATDSLRLWDFHVDWANPAASTFGVSGQPNVVLDTAPFDGSMCGGSRACIPQPGTTGRLDTIARRLMFRLQYRNLGGHRSLVVNHTVDATGADKAGVRWYELRDTGGGWTIQQQGTYAPDAQHRWMGSAAMDGAGDIAVGYSVASSTVFPSIRYSGRLATDPPNQLSQGEATLFAGSGSQTHSASRWGDYSSMSVDPTDDCTFWYTTEYYSVTSSADWRTRVGSFRFPECSQAANLSVAMTDAPDPAYVGGPAITYRIKVSNAGPGTATGVSLTDALPSELRLRFADSTQGTCVGDGSTVSCSVGTLGRGSSATVRVVADPRTPGAITNVASVAAAERDPSPANNTASEITTVRLDETAPVVELLRPRGGVYVADQPVVEAGDVATLVGPVTLRARAADPETAIASFDFEVDGVSVGAVGIDPETGEYFFVYDPEPGPHTVAAVAVNGGGTRAQSSRQVLGVPG